MKFKVGDRVHVYGAGWDCRKLGRKGFFDEAFESPWTAVITSFDHNMVNVKRVSDEGRLGDNKILAVYPQQCRLLKHKERRRIWLSPEVLKDPAISGHVLGHSFEDYTEFVEVKKR